MKLSTSRASTFLSCPRKFKFAYIHEREPIEPDENLELGTAWHHLLECHYRGLIVPTLKPNPAQKLTRHHVEFLNAAYRKYAALHAGLPFEEVLLVEEEREIPLGADTLVCRFDGVVRHAGETWVLEIKTTSSDISPGSYYWERLALNQQVSWYMLAATELGYNPSGVIYDVLKKPGFRRTKAESAEQFTNRCLSDLEAYPEKYFAREVVTRTSLEIDEAKQNFGDIAKLIGTSAYPQNTNNCFQFGRNCEYLPVCSKETNLNDDRVYRLKVKR